MFLMEFELEGEGCGSFVGVVVGLFVRDVQYVQCLGFGFCL